MVSRTTVTRTMVTRTGSPIEIIRGAGELGVPAETGTSGLVLGEDQKGNLVSVALFRPRRTRVLAVGGARFAVLVGLRALALGARVSIQSAYPAQWNLLVRQGLELDRSRGRRPASLPRRPELIIVDHLAGPPAAPPAAAEPSEHAPWSTVLTARSGFTPADVEVFGRADLALLQPMSPPDATLLASVLKLAPAHASQFTAIRPDLVVVCSGGTIRWVRLAPTLLERHLIGDPTER
jgi:hypothetical protein